MNETKSLFSFGYYSSSLQTALFSDNVFHDSYAKELIDENIIKNSLRLNEIGSEKLMSNFSLNYLHKDIEKSIYLDLANFYFDNEKYRYALKWFSKIRDSDVPKNEINRYSFNKAYTLFSAKKFKKSKSYFEKIKNVHKYESDAHYYLGYISYQLDDYDSAVESFRNVSNNKQRENLTFFQVEMNFRLGRFEKAIELGLKELKSIKEELLISEITSETALPSPPIILCSSNVTINFLSEILLTSCFLSIGFIVCILITAVLIFFSSSFLATSKLSCTIEPHEKIVTSKPSFNLIDLPISKL